jgi:hypothetical protein
VATCENSQPEIWRQAEVMGYARDTIEIVSQLRQMRPFESIDELIDTLDAYNNRQSVE